MCEFCWFSQIYVVDSCDRERIGKAATEFQVSSDFLLLVYYPVKCLSVTETNYWSFHFLVFNAAQNSC